MITNLPGARALARLLNRPRHRRPGPAVEEPGYFYFPRHRRAAELATMLQPPRTAR